MTEQVEPVHLHHHLEGADDVRDGRPELAFLIFVGVHCFLRAVAAELVQRHKVGDEHLQDGVGSLEALGDEASERLALQVGDRGERGPQALLQPSDALRDDAVGVGADRDLGRVDHIGRYCGERRHGVSLLHNDEGPPGRDPSLARGSSLVRANQEPRRCYPVTNGT